MITQERLKELFDYREDGHLVYRANRRKMKAGSIAGCIRDDGYWGICVDYRLYPAHWLVWIFHYGEIPTDKEIDHKDRDRSNNRIGNLRLATRNQNLQNMSKTQNKYASNFKGVSRGYMGRWRVNIYVDGKRIFLGQTRDELEAAKIYNEAALKYFGDRAHLNKIQ